MSFSSVKKEIELQFAPPKYLSLPTAGIDISASGIKIVTIAEHSHGLQLKFFTDAKFPVTSAPDLVGSAAQKETADLLATLADQYHIHRANIALPEARGYLFEATVQGKTPAEWRTEVEQHLDEYVPLPPAEVSFDLAEFGSEGSKKFLIGMGCAHRVVDETLAMYESAGIMVRSIEGEMFALPRALLGHGNNETVLIIDIGKSSTKLLVATNRLPRFATTLDIGGHTLTLAVQKYFGVTEEEAKQVKLERGLVPGPEGEEYIAAMLSTVSVLREEISRRIDYWDSRKNTVAGYEKITRAILVGGNSSVRGLPEYLESFLKIPVELGNVFTNFTPISDWLPPLDYTESLAFATAIGLALREYVP